MYFTQLFLYPHCEGAVVAAHFSSECNFKLDFLANPPSADTMVWSLLQESPSLWHFMTTRHGQKMTSASRRERGSRLSTARKLQLLISPHSGEMQVYEKMALATWRGADKFSDESKVEACTRKRNVLVS